MCVSVFVCLLCGVQHCQTGWESARPVVVPTQETVDLSSSLIQVCTHVCTYIRIYSTQCAYVYTHTRPPCAYVFVETVDEELRMSI